MGILCFSEAFRHINPALAVLLQKLQPIFAIATATIFLKEKFDNRYIKWALLAILSAYFVTFANGLVNLQTGEGTIIAALYALGAAFAWGSSTTFSKMLLGKVDFKVFAVQTKDDLYVSWKKFIVDNKLSDFIHVFDPVHINNLKEKFDIYSTPVIYVLDRDKRIKAKRLGAEQVAGLIEALEAMEKNQKK